MITTWRSASIVIRDTTLFHEQRQLQDEFLALAGHELRTPLTSVVGYLDLLLMQHASTSQDERLLLYATQARAAAPAARAAGTAI